MLKCLHEASAEDVVTTPGDAALLVSYKVGKVAWISTGLRYTTSWGKCHFLTDEAVNLLHWNLICFIRDTWAGADFFGVSFSCTARTLGVGEVKLAPFLHGSKVSDSWKICCLNYSITKMRVWSLGNWKRHLDVMHETSIYLFTYCNHPLNITEQH